MVAWITAFAALSEEFGHRRASSPSTKGHTIISQDLFDRAQEQLQENKRLAKRNNTHHEYLLRGLVTCESRGYAMYGKREGYAQYRYSYYHGLGQEAARWGGPLLCPEPRVRVDFFDPIVWQKVAELLLTPELVFQEYQRRSLRSIRLSLVKTSMTAGALS